jgi:TolB protein
MPTVPTTLLQARVHQCAVRKYTAAMTSRRLHVAAAVGLALSALSGLAGCVRGVQMQESPLLRALERKHGRIAYEGPDGNIYTIDQTAKDRKQITTDGSASGAAGMSYGAPTWSFDGRYLAYAMYRKDAEGTTTESALLLGDRDGTGRRTLMQGSTHMPFYIYFAPDSRHLSVTFERPDLQAYELGIFPVEQSGPYTVLDSGVPLTWVWRSDGKSLVEFVGGERLSIVEIEPAPVRTEIPATPGLFQAPDLSPDGKQLLYVRGNMGSLALVVRTLQGGAETTIATSPGVMYFGFSPDGKRIAYLELVPSSDAPTGTLTIVTPGSKVKPVKLKEEPVIGFYWSPDSRRIACLMPWAPKSASDIDQAFAVDETVPYTAVMIADPSTGRSWLGARFPTTEGFFSNLQFFDQLQRSDTMWSPDSRFFIFTAYTSDKKEAVFIASADGNLKPRFIDYGGNASWSRR